MSLGDAFDLDDEPKALTKSATSIDRVENGRWIEAAQKELFDQARAVIGDALHFRDLDPALTEPPPMWTAELGEEEAWKRFRMAKAAWENLKTAPVGLKLAKEVIVGISKAVASKTEGPRVINLVKVELPGGHVEFPEMEVDK